MKNIGNPNNPCLSDCWLWKENEGICIQRPGSNCFSAECNADSISGSFQSKLFSSDMELDTLGEKN